MLSGFFHRNKRLLHSNNWMKKVLTRLALNIATARIQIIVSGTLLYVNYHLISFLASLVRSCSLQPLPGLWSSASSIRCRFQSDVVSVVRCGQMWSVWYGKNLIYTWDEKRWQTKDIVPRLNVIFFYLISSEQKVLFEIAPVLKDGFIQGMN